MIKVGVKTSLALGLISLNYRAEYALVAKQARTTFSNVVEPPIADACIVIDILKPEIDIEEIMDAVTSAMHIE